MNFYLKDGKKVIIAEATKEDAQRIIDFYNIVGGETDFLSFGKDEFTRNADEYGAFLAATQLEQNSIILLATLNGEIISIASINSTQKNRIKHVGTLGIVISEQFTAQGLGRKMMEQLIDWATTNGVTRKISLVTREDNALAIALYEKLGFEKEGLLKNDTFINGHYFHTLMMSLFI